MICSARALSPRAHHLVGVGMLALAAACAGDGSSIAAPSSDGAPTIPGSPDAPSLAISTTTSNPIAGAAFWIDPYSNARATANAWRISRPADAAQMDKVAAQGTAKWIGNWNTNVQADVDAATTAMSRNGALPVFVAYNVPQRDCGGLSGGNTTTVAAYRSWIDRFANGIGGRRAVVVLEPDALAAMDCLTLVDQQLRIDLIKYAVQAFTAKGSIAVYIDAGHSRWKPASTMASRLARAGVAMAQGFSLNVSNFHTSASNVSYGTQVSALIGGKHFVIDTGRNGLGPTSTFQWCNPAGRALGIRPTTATGNALVDAYLWIKTPGESDGACNGAPKAGAWMPSYALGLAQRAAY